MFDEIIQKMETAIATLIALIRAGHPLCGTVSGKDSTCASIPMLEAVRSIGQAGEAQPAHYISTADTTIENSSLARHIETMLEEIDHFADGLAMSVTTRTATPSPAAQFVLSTIGRGTLVRTPQDGVRDGKRIRACADSWKLQPQGRLRAQLGKNAADACVRENISVVGTRLDESASRRAAMIERSEQ